MLFLDLDIMEEIGRSLMAWLCKFIYKLIANLFELFINISKVELLSSDSIKEIYQRVTMVLTIVMVFYVTFELVKYIIQPDNIKDKEKGASKNVVRMIIVVVLLAFVPQIFSLAYKLQNSIIEKQVLSKVILGKSNTSTTTFGRNFSADMFSLFYYYDKNLWGEEQKCESVDCQTLVDGNISDLRTTGSIDNISYAINASDEITENGVKSDVAFIHFDGLFAVLVGVFLIYVLVLYCVDLGVRVAQMVFLQIIAPIPIIGYLSPKKDNIFTKWVKQCLTTYLDLFIRLSIIYFVLLVCKKIAEAYRDGTLIRNVEGDSKVLVYIAVILGLLLFAQKAPKMLQELFPKMGAASGNFGLKGKERTVPFVTKAAAKTLGMSAGAVRGLVRSGIAHGKNIHDRNKKLKEALRKEGNPTDRKSMKRARKEAKQNAKASEKALKDKNRELTKAENEVKEAEKKLRHELKHGDDKSVEEAKNNLAKAQKKYENVRTGVKSSEEEMKNRKANAENKITESNQKINSAKNKKAAAADKLRSATTEEEKADAQKELADAEADIKKYEEEKAAAEKEKAEADADLEYNNQTKSKKLYDKALKDYEEATKEGSTATPAEKEAARRRYEQAKARYDLEQRTGYLGIKSDNIDAQSALADKRNQSYGAYTGFRVAGAALRGAVTGATAGAKVKKFSEIKKQTDEGLKKINKSETDYMQYLQDGGSATFSGTVDRAVTHAEQKAGIKTESDRYKYEIKDLEDKIKLKKAEAERETSVKQKLDDAKSRSGQKIDAGEQKIALDDNLENCIKDSQGNKISWLYALGINDEKTPAPDEKLNDSIFERDATGNLTNTRRTTSSMLQAIKERENRSINEAETANRLYQEAQARGATQDELATLKKAADQKAAEAEERKTISKLARKRLLEYGVTKAIQGDRSDNILADLVTSLKNNIDINRNSPSAREHIRKGIEARFGDDTEKINKIWNAFIYNNVQDYEDVDVIEGLLTNHVGILNNEASALQAQANKISESSMKGAADAAAAGGNSNK